MPVTLFAFSQFAPDGSRYGLGALSSAVNMLPLDGGFRSLRRASLLSAYLAAPPINGAHVHVAQALFVNQTFRPDGDTTPGGWQPNAATSLFDALDEETRSDADSIFTGGAPTADLVKLSTTNGVAPAAGNHFHNYRYQVQGYSATSKSVTSITRVGAVATATVAAHGYVNGDSVAVSGAAQPEYNVTATISNVTTNTFDYTVAGAPATPATGTILAQRAWWLLAEVLEGSTVRRTDTLQAGVADVTFADRLTTFAAPAIGDYTNLFFRFTATVPGVATFLRPSADGALNGWMTAAGAAANLYQQIDEISADDADYVRSPAFSGAPQSAAYTVSLPDTTQVHIAKTHTVRYRYFAENAGMTLTVTLLAGSTTVAVWTHTAISAGAWVTQAQALSNSQRDLLKSGNTYLTGLTLKFDASYPTVVASTVTQFGRPSSDVSNPGGWSPTPGGSLYTTIDESSLNVGDNVQATVVPASGDLAFTVGLSALVDPGRSDGHGFDLWIDSSYSVGSARGVLVELIDTSAGGTVIASNQFAVPHTGVAKYTYNLTAAEANAIGDYAALNLRVTMLHDGTTWGATVYMAQFFTPAAQRVRVSWTELELPSPARAEVSWVDYEAPQPATAYQGDASTVFGGHQQKIYSWNKDGTTTDLSGAVYGAGDFGSWFFASYGNHVIATNWFDPVQWRQNNAGNFANLITSVELPKARFCCAAREQLMLGGINLVNHAADEVWWSAVGNVQDFHPSISTQCDFQRLLQTPGQIMGMVGGNDPLIFKRASLYRMRWVGGDLVWMPELISGSIGTPYPHSIVEADDAVYWWGGNSFWSLRGDELAPVGRGKIVRALTDSLYSRRAIRQIFPSSMREEDQIMCGAYDRYSGLIVWMYQAAKTAGLSAPPSSPEGPWQHTRGVVYNPVEDRWAELAFNFTAADPLNNRFSHLVSRPNVIDDGTHDLKGVLGWLYDGNNDALVRWDSAPTWNALLVTKVFPIELENQDRPKNVRLSGLMPLFTGETADATWPDVTVQVEAAQDPRMLLDNTSQNYTASVSADQQQWLPFDITGRWFRISILFPSLTSRAVRQVEGVYFRWEERGQ